jgi:hypothetical protein
MTENRLSDNVTAEKLSRDVRNRIKAIILTSSIAVALAFGLSFYFALISNEAAVAQQIPELEAVARKFKHILIVNTAGCIAIVLASFHVLSSMITNRMFRPLESMMAGLRGMADKRIPKLENIGEEGPFAPLQHSFAEAVKTLHEVHLSELENLNHCISILSDPADRKKLHQKLTEMISRKKKLIGLADEEVNEQVSGNRNENLFMQPV